MAALTQTNFSTPQLRADFMNLLINSIVQPILNLKDRWQDEKDYEDFKEYKKIVEELIIKNTPNGTQVLNISKTFKIDLQINGFPYVAQLFFGASIGWKSLPKK